MGEREAVSVSRSYLEWKINDCKIKFIFAKQNKKQEQQQLQQQQERRQRQQPLADSLAGAQLLSYWISRALSVVLSRFLSLYHYLPCSVCLALPPSILVSEFVCVCAKFMLLFASLLLRSYCAALIMGSCCCSWHVT